MSICHECECDGKCWQRIKYWGKSFRDNSSAIQAVAAILGLSLIFYAIKSFMIEYEKFNFDYGDQISLSLSGSSLIAKANNRLITDLRVTTDVYLAISKEKYSVEGTSYYLLNNFFVCPGDISFYQYNNRCDHTNRTFQVPAQRAMNLGGQFLSLKIIFGNSPFKSTSFPFLVYISTVEYTDPKGEYRKENFFSQLLIEGTYYSSNEPTETSIYPQHYRVTEEQLNTIFQRNEIIGSFDYAKTRPLGLAEHKLTKNLLLELSKKRWHKRFIEPSSLRRYRTVFMFGGGDIVKWQEFKAQETFLAY